VLQVIILATPREVKLMVDTIREITEPWCAKRK